MAKKRCGSVFRKLRLEKVKHENKIVEKPQKTDIFCLVEPRLQSNPKIRRL